MKRRALFTVALVLVLAGMASAQEMQKPRLWVVYTEVVKPSKLMEYEAGTKEMMGVMRANEINSPMVRFNGIALDGFDYVYVIPIENMAGLDSMQAEWMKAIDKVGKTKWMDMARRGGNNVEYYSHTVVIERPDLSYRPENPRLKPEEAPFTHYSFYYLLPGREQESEEIAKQYVELFRKKNIAQPFTIYQAAFGDELPLLIAASPAKDMADWVANNQKVEQALGSEGRSLQMRAMSVTRRLEEKNGRFRPDLSYTQ